MEIPDDGVGDKDSKRMQQDGVKKRKAKLCDMPRDNISSKFHFPLNRSIRKRSL